MSPVPKACAVTAAGWDCYGGPVRPSAALSDAWEVHVRWGTLRVAAEVLDGRGRRALSLGDGAEDDVALGSPARIRFAWRPGHLDVRFTGDVSGTLQLKGDAPATLSQLAKRGLVKEADHDFTVTLGDGDEVNFEVGTLTIRVRQVRARFARAVDLQSLAVAVLLVAFALASVGAAVVSFGVKGSGPKLEWLKRRPPPARAP